MGKYKFRNLGPISYYIRIRVARDWVRRRIELLIEAYLDKIGDDYRSVKRPYCYIPMQPKHLALKA